jgi:chromosome segregation ATPase
MRTVKESGPAIGVDLDKTDELPVLDVAAYEAAAKDWRNSPVTNPSDTDSLPIIDIAALIDNVQKAEARIAQQATEHETLERELREARAHIEESRQNGQRLSAEIQTVRDDLAVREDMLFRALHSLGERDAELAEARREHAKSVEQLQTAAKRSVEEAEATARSLREELAADKKRSAARLEAHDKQAAERLQANTKQAAAELEANSRRAAAQLETTTKHAAAQLEATTKRAAAQADSSAKQIGDLRGEVQSLRGELDTARAEMKSSSATVAALQSQIERSETALQATRRESERLKISADKYLERLRSREWRQQDADNSMRALDAQLAASQDGAAKFEREARELNARVEALDNRIQEREQQIQALETAAAGSIEAARGQASALQAAEQNLQSLSKQIAAHESAHSQLQHERNELVATLGQRERSLQEVLAARADLTAKCATLEKQQGANGSRITQLEKQLAESLRLGGEAQEQARLKRESLEAEAQHAQEAIAAARADASKQHARIDALNTELATAASVHGARVGELQQALEELRRHKLAIEEDALYTQIALEESAQRTQEALTGARADAAEQRAKLESLNADFAQTTARLQEIRRPADEAEAEVQRLNAALASKVQEVESAQDENRKLQGSLELARGALKEHEFLIRRLERNASSNAQVLGHLQTSIERLGSANPASLTGIAGTAADTPATLVRLDGAGANTAFTLAARTRVGRAPDSDLRIDSTSVSRYHAIILSGRHTIIEDLNSTNGVLINGRKVNRQKLKDGDLVAIGEARFRFADRNTSSTDANPVSSAPSERP